mmetsp:Transcript_39332/g.117663  ORF Transcript_39332/g.117663 Transcript_39332/m.117663 type:complete len:277 (+) Transcript_39332:105-935(+)
MYVGDDLSRSKLQFNGHEDIRTWLNNRRGLFPALHSLLAFAIYGVPILSGVQLGLNASVQYWIGWFPWLVLSVPVLLVLSHMVHAIKQRPLFNAMLLSTVIPALIVILLGYMVLMPISGISDRLMSSDCSTYTDKAYLNDAYKAATRIWNDCLRREINQTGKPLEQIQLDLTIDQCEEYQQALQSGTQWKHQWHYLRELEVNQVCSGWCYAGQESLWTTDHQPKDVCGAIVGGSILNGLIKREASRMLTTGLFALVMSLISLIIVQEYMIRLGVEW